ncbi:cellulose binding domain-containing protein [Anaerobacterium chartisolvens]|uniref:Cellulose binding domain-containing protein n=1 Tax=Anaerobacterium chartisolvens TaxID=1297424 RepID=A0A369BE60_9FIRM|nr:cellulose binding domain-containing protein [Anaerobacterium chartisolvens]RCX18767.1 cellulose binding domain-containing protein [Anaerobacterium chartisolvens]
MKKHFKPACVILCASIIFQAILMYTPYRIKAMNEDVTGQHQALWESGSEEYDNRALTEAAPSISLQMYNSNTSPQSNTISLNIKICNIGTAPINKSDLAIRYYYTVDEEKQQSFWCDWSDSGSSNVYGSFIKMASEQPGADCYLEIGFKSGSGVLAPGDSTEIKCRATKNDWTNYDQSDDYSFNPAGSGYSDWDRTSAYCAGGLLWGNEPGMQDAEEEEEDDAGEGSGGSLKLQVYHAGKGDRENTLYIWYKLYNTGDAPVKLEDAKIRYYYTVDNEERQSFFCDWSSVGSTYVKASFQRINVGIENADCFLEIGFKSGAGVLGPGEGAELQCRVANSSWTSYSQFNDYSFDRGNTGYRDWDRAVIYINGDRAWGTEPIAAPEGITLVPGLSSMDISWGPVACAEGYEVEADGAVVYSGAEASYIHTGLVPGTEHTYRVRARNSVMLSPWSEYVTGVTLIDKPSNIIKDVTETRISIRWDEVEGAGGYDVELNGDITDNGQLTGYILDGLLPGDMYTFRVRARGAAANSGWTELMEIPTLPDVPLNIRTVSGSSFIKVLWNEVHGASGYDIEVYGTPVDNGASASYTHTGLEANTQRIYRVRAKNSSGAGVWSEVTAASTLPAAPNNIWIDASDIFLKITWDNQAGADGYDIEIDGTNVIGLDTNTYMHTPLEANSQHVYRVRSRNADGVSEWSEEIKGIVLPLSPSDITVLSVTDSEIGLSWMETEGAWGYDLEVDGTVIDNGAAVTYLHKGLAPDTAHTYRVRARSESTLGDWSTLLEVCTLLPVPSGLKAHSEDGEIVLEWDAVMGADGYDIEIDGELFKTGIDTRYIHEASVAGTEHTYRVRAFNGNGSGDWSDPAYGTALLGKPLNITFYAQSTSIALAWDGVEGATDYDVLADGEIADNGSGTEYVHRDLKPNSMHTYRVRARNEICTGEWSDPEAVFTLVGIPANVKASVEDGGITLIWDEVDGAAEYDVEDGADIINNGCDPIYLHNGLEADAKYTFRVRAKNENGEGQWSEPVTVVTGPLVPVNIKAEPEINKITLTWEGPDNAASYDVEADGEVVEGITDAAYAHEGLLPNTRHEYRVRARNEDGVCGEWSALVEANTVPEITIEVARDAEFSFVIALPAKQDVDKYSVEVQYNPGDIEVLDLYAATAVIDMESGRIEGTGIEVEELSGDRIVYGVENAGKPVVIVLRLMSRTNAKTGMSYRVE